MDNPFWGPQTPLPPPTQKTLIQGNQKSPSGNQLKVFMQCSIVPLISKFYLINLYISLFVQVNTHKDRQVNN